MPGDRNLATDIFVPNRLVRPVEQQRAPALIHRFIQERERTYENIDLLALQRAQHGIDVAGSDPCDLLGKPHRLHVIRRPDMVGATERRYRDDGFTAIGTLPFSQFLQRRDALVPEIFADDEHHRAAAGIDRHQNPPRAPVIGELHRVGDIADADIPLRGGDDLARLDAAPALDDLAVKACVLEIANPVRYELRLIKRHRDRINRASAFAFSPRSAYR